MLRVTKLSGEEVASIAVGEVRDARSLKQRLSQLPGVPARFRQRLLLDGSGLEDADELDSPMDLKLVLLPFADVSGRQAEDFVEAAVWDSAAE
ncbi:Kidins220, partial [Symbiodinium natans]